jgi:hypothetical protein
VNSLRDLQEWDAAQCDGDWEHMFGVRIASLDNPGWLLEIDLGGTGLESRPFGTVIDGEARRWVHMQVSKGVWKGACHPLGLDQVIDSFLAWARRHGAPITPRSWSCEKLPSARVAPS